MYGVKSEKKKIFLPNYAPLLFRGGRDGRFDRGGAGWIGA